MSRTEEANLRFIRVQEKVVLPEPVLKAGGTRLEVLKVVSGWFDEGGVKLRVISIFVTVDAVTIDKPANR